MGNIHPQEKFLFHLRCAVLEREYHIDDAAVSAETRHDRWCPSEFAILAHILKPILVEVISGNQIIVSPIPIGLPEIVGKLREVPEQAGALSRGVLLIRDPENLIDGDLDPIRGL